MEIKEIVSYFLNSGSNILEVSFRSIDDEEDVLRTDNIDYSVVSEYGFELETETLNFFSEEFEDDLIVECFTNFMNELNNSGVLSKVKLKKSDKLQLHYLDCNSPYLDEYIIYIGNDKKPLQSIELNR